MRIDTTYIAATAAVLSAIISPLVSWRIARSTIAANKITAGQQASLAYSLKIADFRQAWINDLRVSLVELQAAFSVPLSHLRADRVYDGQEVDGVMRIVAKIELLLNRHDSYYESLMEAVERFQDAPTDSLKRQRRHEPVRCCQDVLKIEWDRLKSDLTTDP